MNLCLLCISMSSATKIKKAETIIFLTVTYGSESWTVRKRERKKNWCFWAMDVEKNFTSSLDREENKLFNFGRHETLKITWSDNPPTKITLLWSRHESKKVTGTGHYAWTNWRTQEAGKTTDAMAWQHEGSNRPTIGRHKRSSTR
jgi:hypothetical protein